MTDLEKSILNFEIVCKKQQKLYAKNICQIKTELNAINLINEKMCKLMLLQSDKSIKLKLMKCAMDKIARLEKINKINNNVEKYSSDICLTYNEVLRKNMAERQGLDGKLLEKNFEQRFRLLNSLRLFQNMRTEFTTEKFLAENAIFYIGYDNVKRNKQFWSKCCKMVFAGDINSILNLVKDEKLKTKLPIEELQKIEDRVFMITTDTPVPITNSEYQNLQSLYYEAQKQDVNIPFNRSDSKIRSLFCVKHENKATIYKEFPCNYTLEY